MQATLAALPAHAETNRELIDQVLEEGGKFCAEVLAPTNRAGDEEGCRHEGNGVVRTPADLERETASPGGSIYGTSSNGARAAFLRPANAARLPGLFLVGGSSHP